MRKTICAGVFAFAALGALCQQPAGAAETIGYAAPGQTGRSIDIAQIHGALHLTAYQERYWAPVEAALRGLARQQAGQDGGGFVHRVSRRVVSVVLNNAAVAQLVAAARPLVAVLSDDQKRVAAGMAQDMGLGPVIAALN
jgi:hypothetical protein